MLVGQVCKKHLGLEKIEIRRSQNFHLWTKLIVLELLLISLSLTCFKINS